MVYSFYWSKKYPNLPAMLYHLKSQIKLKMEYCCHIRVVDTQSSFSNFESILLLSHLHKSQIRPKWNIAAISRLELYNLQFPSLIESFCHPSSLQDSDQIKMEYCCHIWAGTIQSSLCTFSWSGKKSRNFLRFQRWIIYMCSTCDETQ